MEMKHAYVLLLLMTLSACSKDFQGGRLERVYVEDFTSSNIQQCKPEDVDLSNAQAKAFFERARIVDSRTLHDHYEYAPCAIEGVATYAGQSCSWQIQASATGRLRCGETTWLFVCDECDDLFDTSK